MNTRKSCIPSFRNARLAALVGLAIFAMAGRLPAQYNITSAYLSITFDDGSGSPPALVGGVNGSPSPTVGGLRGAPLVSPLPAGGYGISVPPGVNSTYTYGYSPTTSQASVIANFLPSFYYRSNTVGFAELTGTDITLTQNKSPTPVSPAEFRLDWTINATYTGPTTTLDAGTMFWFHSANSPGNYDAVAFQLSITDNNTAANSSVQIPLGGDTPTPAQSAFLDEPPSQFWLHNSTTDDDGLGYTGSTITVNNGDTLTEVGFMDVVADPATVHLKFVDYPPYKITISNNGPQQVKVSWPTNANVNSYNLTKSTSLTSPSWTAVTNPVVVVGNQNTVVLNTTNVTQFFQLKGTH